MTSSSFGTLIAGVGLAALVTLFACSDDEPSVGPLDADGGPDGAGSSSGASGSSGTSGSSGQPGDRCGDDGITGGFAGSKSITVNGAARTYELYVPDAYDSHTTYPLVFVFHGDGGTGAGMRSAFDLETVSGGGAIIVYPDGLGNTWDIDDAAGLGKDTAFIDAIAADLAKTHCADSKRLFAVGFSKGAYFVNQLVCTSSSNFRAVVSHAGGGPFYLDGSGMSFDDNGNLVCPAPPVAALQVQGTSDNNVPPDEGMKARDHWIAANECTSSTTAYDPSPCVTYDGCNAARPEVWCLVPSLGHQIWNQGVQTTWDFLKSK